MLDLELPIHPVVPPQHAEMSGSYEQVAAADSHPAYGDESNAAHVFAVIDASRPGVRG